MDRNELKIQALLEKISALTANYENQIADMRVDLTILSSEKQELADELAQVRGQLEETVEHTQTDVPQSEEDSDSTD